MGFFSSGSSDEFCSSTPDAWRGNVHTPDWPEEQASAEYFLFLKDLDAPMMKKPIKHEEIIKMFLQYQKQKEDEEREVRKAIDDLLDNL
jgi:hypothetical protein